MVQHVDLHRFRKENKLKQSDIATASGLDRSRISKYESGVQRTEYVYSKLTKAYPKLLEYEIQISESRNQFGIELESKNNNPKIEIHKTKKNTFKTLNGITVIEIPLVSMKAHAQYLDEFHNEANDITFEMVNLEVDHFGLGNYLAFDVKGDSMNGGLIDDTPDGARVLTREIGQHLWRNGLYKSKHGHIIVTNKNILFKDIVDVDLVNGYVTLHSRNKSEEYKDFKLKMGYSDEDHILQIFKVLKRFNM